MRMLLLAAIATGAAITAAVPADARQGCGVEAHRGPNGHCRPDRGRVVVHPVRIGTYHPARGYWDGHRYRGHRYRWQGGWRYR